MNFKLKLAFFIYLSNVVLMLVIGFTFEYRSQFMPFHAEVIQTQWQNLSELSQILYLGMMRTEGAGFLAAATALMFLLWFPFRKFEAWSYWAMTAVGLVEYVPTLIANYHVATVTSAAPPWPLMLALSLSLLVALCSASLGHREPIALESLPNKKGD